MTQHLVTHEMLVGLAQKRELSTVFEKAWQERTGVNPVARAIQMSQRSRSVKEWGTLLGTCFVSFLLYLALFVSAIVVIRSEENFSAITLSMAAIGVFIFYTIIFFSLVVQVFRWLEKNPPITYQGMDEFLADISALCIWLDPKFLSTEILLSSNENVVKLAAHNLLVSLAGSLVRLERSSCEDTAGMLIRFSELGRVREAFSHKYDTFARIGLASGGYDKYFKEAKRGMRRAKAVEAAPAAA